jgi:cellulose synthase/poly-beta-1,6-N-acetylglucosamine synthase-like glycosyltransferase
MIWTGTGPWTWVGGLALLLGAHLAWTAARAVRSGRAAWTRDATQPPLATRPLEGTTPPGISVFIPAWNDAAVLPGTLRACLEELGRSDPAMSGPVRLIVVAGGDDGSYLLAQDAVREGARRHPGVPATVLLQTPMGKNAALNQGLRAAGQEVLVFLDADTKVQSGWLAALTAPLLRGEADAATGHFQPSVPTKVSRIFEVQQELAQQVRQQVNLFGGGSIAVTRAALESIGGALPEEVLVGVDFDLTQRLRQTGQRFSFCPGARVQTEISSTWPEFWHGEVRWQAAYLASQKRHLRGAAGGASSVLRLGLGMLYVPGVYLALLTGWLAAPLLALLLTGFAPGMGWPAASAGLLSWLAFVVWVLGRHVCAHLEVAAYAPRPHLNRVWLGGWPTYAAAFCVSATACWWALLGQQAATPHFKGRRSQPQDSQIQGSQMGNTHSRAKETVS